MSPALRVRDWFPFHLSHDFSEGIAFEYRCLAATYCPTDQLHRLCICSQICLQSNDRGLRGWTAGGTAEVSERVSSTKNDYFRLASCGNERMWRVRAVAARFETQKAVVKSDLENLSLRRSLTGTPCTLR